MEDNKNASILNAAENSKAENGNAENSKAENGKAENGKAENGNAEPKIIGTGDGAKDGQDKCPKCGATDISLNKNTAMLRCNFCRHEFEPEKATGIEKDVSLLKGMNIGEGAQEIESDADHMVTIKCQSCGAEIVVDTEETTQAKCHWCRNVLSINQKIPNGVVPDLVLPFATTKEEARSHIEKFVLERRFFGQPKFKKEFSTENIVGVYLPYMIVDVNARATFKGMGEHQTAKYTRGVGKNKKTYYDADVYKVEREFDIYIDDLTVESNEEKLNKKDASVTNNIINAVMPFDTENATRWRSNYLKGFTSEKRDVDIDNLAAIVETQAIDIARNRATEIIEDYKHYDRGVRWEEEKIQTNGQQWVAAYLPVWIYSYYEKKGKKGITHYTAVNARTNETMGSVPLNMLRLVICSIIAGIIGSIFGYLIMEFLEAAGEWGLALGLISAFLYFVSIYASYRNTGERHYHEAETTSKVDNIREVDEFVENKKKMKNAMIKGWKAKVSKEK